MANEQFYPKQRGDPLSARNDWNPLTQVAGRFARLRPGSRENMFHGSSVVSSWSPMPLQEFVVEVSDTTDTDGIYLVKIRYYDHVDEEWKSDAKEWRYDARAGFEVSTATGGGVEGIYIGRRLQVFWDGQRGTFVGGNFSQHDVRNFELKDALAQFSDQEVDAYPRYWDPTLHGGWGGFITICDEDLVFKVADWNEEGHTAGIGGRGKCHMYQSNNGLIGVIFDLCCPGDEQVSCESE
jgi:hypothetical protein